MLPLHFVGGASLRRQTLLFETLRERERNENRILDFLKAGSGERGEDK